MRVRIDKTGTDYAAFGVYGLIRVEITENVGGFVGADDLSIRHRHRAILDYPNIQHFGTALRLAAGRTCYELAGIVNYEIGLEHLLFWLCDLFMYFRRRHQRSRAVPRRHVGHENAGLYRRVGFHNFCRFFDSCNVENI